MKTSVLKRALCFFFSVVLVCTVLIPQSSRIISAATVQKQTVKSSVIREGKQFTLNNMPFNGEGSIIRKFKDKALSINTVQNFDYTPDGKYVFTVSECNTGSKKHGLLSRCKLPSKKGVSAKAKCLEAVVLEGFGHSDVIAVTQDNLKKQAYNIWLSYDTGADGKDVRIARLTYQVSEEGKGKITKTVYIKGFEKTNVSKGKAGYYKDRVKAQQLHCAVDSDSNQIVFRLTFPSGYSCAYLSYNLKNINKALDSLKNKSSFDISKKPKWQKARIICGLTPLCSFQSFAVKDKSLYLAGGNMGLGAEIYVIDYKTYKDGKIKEKTVKKKSQLSEIITLDTVIKIDDAYYDENYLEIEGFKVTKSKNKTAYHISFNCSGPSIRDTISVYKFTTK